MSNNDKGGRQDTYTKKAGSSFVRRRALLRTTGAGAVGTALAGCLGNGNGDGNGNGNGNGDSDLPDTITLGALGPADLLMGDSIMKSAELAVDEINAADGIGGSDVELSTKDTKDDPGTTRQVY
jgi:ABC-type branched-subunit amino acid transport system substrate-binding protein